MTTQPKLSSIALTNLPNETHLQFMREVQAILDSNSNVQLALGNLYPLFDQLLGVEDIAIEKIRKSAVTAQIEQYDTARDSLYTAIGSIINAFCKSPLADEAEAARQLKVVYDNYGSIHNKAYAQETSIITNLVQDLNAGSNYLSTLNIENIVTRLGEINNGFISLIAQRDSENTDKTAVGTATQARADMDQEYTSVTTIVQAALLTATPASQIAFANFINSLNTIIARYKPLLKKHSSHSTGGEEEIIEEEIIEKDIKIIEDIKH